MERAQELRSVRRRARITFKQPICAIPSGRPRTDACAKRSPPSRRSEKARSRRPSSATRWYNQGHIFGTPIYYIDYALAETGAMQLSLLDTEDPARTVETYLALCRLGGKKSVLEIFASAGLESPFSPASMKRLMAHALESIG